MRSMQSIDFGYPWWLSYGHLAVLGVAGALLALALALRWAGWVRVGLGVVALWSLAAFGVMHFHFNVNAKAELPTENFMRSGTGHVLDMGAGTGRSSIMVLEARPKATLVASDLFGDSFDRHFGKEGSPQARLEKNLKAAGVVDRATIATADMRKLPFEAASFDAVVSCYAMDHLSGGGSRQALQEAFRVLEPGGDFLLMVIANDGFVKFAFGPLLSHGGTRGAGWWTARAREAGFGVEEVGTPPATLYLLARKPRR